MNNTRLRAADLADEFRFISSDKRMEYVPAQAVHLLIAADMLDANDEMLMRLNAEYRVRQNLAAENAKLRELVADMWHEGMCECGSLGKCATCMYEYPTRMRELGIEVDE